MTILQPRTIIFCNILLLVVGFPSASPTAAQLQDSSTQKTRPPAHVDSSVIYHETPNRDLIVKLPGPVCPFVTVLPLNTSQVVDVRPRAVYIMLQLLLDTSGVVTSSKVLSSSMPGVGFEEEAIKAAQNQRYIPLDSATDQPRWSLHEVLFMPESEFDSPDSNLYLEKRPEMTYTGIPVYPRQLRQSGDTGTVWVKALIDENGSVRAAFALKSSGRELFDCSAVLASLNCQYKPSLQNGKPVAVWVAYKVEFKLKD